MSSTIPTVQFNLKPVYQHYTLPNTHTEVTSTTVVSTRNRGGGRRRRRPSYSSFNSTLFHLESNHVIFCKPNSVSSRTVFTRVSNGGGGGAASQQKSSNTEKKNQSSPAFGDSYVALFVRMLGLDNDPLDREQAIVGLWKYSLGGKKCIDNILQFHGCINLTISLLKSDSDSAHEAAAGLLRSISSIDLYRDVVAESGAIEEISSLLSQSSLTSEVKEQSICTLWNLSIEEKHRVKIANSDILPALIKSLEEDDIKVKEAAGGVLANLALTHSNHNIMVEAGVIPKLATFLKAEIEDQHKVIRKEARNALVELAKNEYYKILIIEEGLVPVPLVGTAAYRSLAPSLHLWPSFPDGTEIDRTSKIPSRFGASELLLGLNIDVNSASVEEAKMKAVIGRSKQQFLARSGAIEVEDAKSGQDEISTKQQFTLLPWVDGVARLVLILELEDETALSRAAEAIADASVNGHMRNSFKEAGAIKHLVRLLGHHSDKIQFAVIVALERLSLRYHDLFPFFR
uniref:U-box domain-containing protein 12 n=2 Tax=Rhizophora mucronata TaxID=61149 RepID=A0A2P2KJT4_RHIMU